MDGTQTDYSNRQTLLSFGASALSKVAITVSTLGLLLGGLLVSVFSR